MKTITCDTNRKDCMYRECSDCKGKVMHADCENEGEQVWWHTWKNRKVEKEKKNASGESIKKSVSITVKEKDCGTAKTLLEDTNVELQKTCRHVYNIRHQYGAIRSLREKVTGDEAIIHIDFSENFNCKYFEEIQSMHFGASQRQITLHTGVFYSKTTTQSFCTVSDCLQHGPPAIWAHLEPILDMLKSDVKILHFISDGPTTQYRNKQNFYLLSKVIFEMGFSGATWNFLEAGHGKGAADGVGAAIKRHADALVTVKKQDIMCANDLVSGLETMSSSIMVFKVDESRVLELEASIPPKLQAIPQTMKIHQVLVEHQYATRSRILSCFCKYPDTCACYAPREFIFQAVGAPNEPTVRSEEEQVGHSSTTLITLDCVDESLIGKYCVVVYDALPYPGVITDVDEDEEVEVNVMHKIGRNRYFWPRMEDILWYKKSDVMTLLDTVPRHVTGRHQEIDPDIWRLIEAKLELE
ncbi:hypothetical protein FSP39_014573 [Pinctada imbricata]|uniref:Uncharacterized protein n=1 Tax=Pinctada imbricata TaxID=66713 RepID=A0AA88YN62_PINIB|nr:hypothetical protein FSP39_014573 [Pinctada imbricata]